MIYKVQTNNYYKNINSLNEYSLLIPREYSRGESDDYTPRQEDVENVPHYSLYIEKQIGSYKNRRDAYIYFKLPKSNKLIPIILHMDGGVSFDKKFHKYLIRETDDLDRKIILGFCDKYHSLLVDACYSDKRDPFIDMAASTYNISKYKKRIKSGSKGIDNTDFINNYNGGFKPYEESSLFKNIVFLS